jgi:lauroyl/myristoyl acyltransferase
LLVDGKLCRSGTYRYGLTTVGRASQPVEEISEVIHSPALCTGSLRATEQARPVRRRLKSATYLKNRAVPLLFWFLREAPRPIALWPVAAALLVARALYWLPANPIRRAAENIAVLGRDAGYEYAARSIYRAYLANARAMAELILRLYRDGWQAVIGDVEFPDSDVESIRGLVETHGGVVVAVPHNLGSTFSGLKFCKAFAAVLLSKNSASIQRTKIALDFFERMDASVLMVRQGGPMQISRSMIKLLRSGKLLAVTVDLLTDAGNGVAARTFGQDVHFPAWSTRIPTAIKAPIVPAYIHCEEGRLRACFGEALVTGDAEAATAHIATFLEERILNDPASWAFLAEKKWGRVLEAAAAVRARSA